MGQSCRTLLWDTLVGHSCGTLLWDTLVGHSCRTLLWDTLVGLSSSSPDTPRTKVVLQGRQFSASSSPDTPRIAVVLQGRQFSASSSTDCSAYSSCTTKSPVLSFQLHRLLRALKLHYKIASSQLPAPQIAPRTKVVLPSHQFSSSNSPDTPRTEVVLQSRSVLACISRARHARSPQRVARAPDKSHSRLHFAHSTRTISAEGCARMGQIALSPAFRALDTHDLRRGLRAHGSNRTRAFRTLDTHDLRRGLRAHGSNRTLACISHTRRARSPQRVASSLQNERFVRDFLKNSLVKVCKTTSVSYETSSKSQMETPIGAHTSRSPAKQFRDSNPSKQHPLTRQSQCDSDIHLYHNSQPHDSLRLPRIFPHPHV